MLAVIGKALLALVIGYGVGAAVAAALLHLFAERRIDHAQMVATTALLICGPAVGLLAMTGSLIHAAFARG